MKNRLSIQSYFRPELTLVYANKDYRNFRSSLEAIDQQIVQCQLESMALDFSIEKMGGNISQKQRQFAIFSLRAELLRSLLGVPSFREYSKSLASSDLLADFCGILEIDGIRWSSKSTLERASKFFSSEQLRQMHELLVEVSANEDWCELVGLQEPVDAGVCLVDSTCLQANIHFPVDWVLLKDVSVTLLKAVKVIRKHGIRNRMVHEPSALMRAMNRLCIEMTHCRRKKDSKKQRKRVFREMKDLLHKVGSHARCHRQKLLDHREHTELSDTQIDRIVERIDEKLELLPKVIKQAHERIIGGRKVDNADKILSVHEPDIHVMVRGKASGEVVPRNAVTTKAQRQFGNGLYLAENRGGFVLDFKLYKQQAPADGQKLSESVQRQYRYQIDKFLESVIGDRGFDGPKSTQVLEEYGVENMICPRDVNRLKERMNEPEFALMQRRRGGTEARIAILKNHGRSRVCRAKGFENRNRWISWAVLVHNMVWITRKVLDQHRPAELQAA